MKPLLHPLYCPYILPLAAEFWLHAVKELGYLFVSYLRMKKIQCRHIEKGLIETPLLQKNKCAIYHQLLCLVWSWDWCFLRWYQGRPRHGTGRQRYPGGTCCPARVGRHYPYPLGSTDANCARSNLNLEKVKIYIYSCIYMAFICNTTTLSFRVAEWIKIANGGLDSNLTTNKNYLRALTDWWCC